MSTEYDDKIASLYFSMQEMFCPVINFLGKIGELGGGPSTSPQTTPILFLGVTSSDKISMDEIFDTCPKS